MRNTAAAQIVRLPHRRPVKLDDGPDTVRLVQAEIFRSRLTYTRIGFDADLCQSTVMKIAQGETTRPAFKTIVKILTALGWDIYASERS